MTIEIDPNTGAPIIKPIETIPDRSDTLTDEQIKAKLDELESSIEEGNHTADSKTLVNEPPPVKLEDEMQIRSTEEIKADILTKVMETKESALTRVQKLRNILRDGGMDSQMVDRSVPLVLALFTE